MPRTSINILLLDNKIQKHLSSRIVLKGPISPLRCVQMGKLRRRKMPEDITINLGRGAEVPECPNNSTQGAFFFSSFFRGVCRWGS